MKSLWSSMLAASVLVFTSCSNNGGSGAASDAGASSTDASRDAGTTLGGTLAPPTSTGNTTVDHLGAAAAACGQQSMFTVPGGWEMLAVGDAGCTVWVPPGWTLQGAHTGIATAMKDATGVEGFVGIAGASQEVACEPVPVRDSVLQGFADKGYASPKVLWHHEQRDEFGGSVWPTGHAVFSTSVSGTSIVGYLWVLATTTVIACDVVGLGFWEPEGAIETDTCALTQIINSVKCPSGGGCSDADCNTQCKADGKTGGSCGPEGGCSCY